MYGDISAIINEIYMPIFQKTIHNYSPGRILLSLSQLSAWFEIIIYTFYTMLEIYAVAEAILASKN